MNVLDALKQIKAEHVFAALQRIESGEYPPENRRATRYCLMVGRRHYPPKWVIRLASDETGVPIRKALGRELFGGPMTNNTLERLGFTVKACPGARAHSYPLVF